MKTLRIAVMEANFGTLIVYFLLMFGIFEQKFSVYAEVVGELNYPCNSVKDCRDFGYICKDRTCQCDHWYIPNNEVKKCLGGVDQKCLYDEHCINGAYCMNQSVCKCKQSSSQPLEHGLICAGATRLDRQPLLRLLFMVICITLNGFLGVYVLI